MDSFSNTNSFTMFMSMILLRHQKRSQTRVRNVGCPKSRANRLRRNAWLKTRGWQFAASKVKCQDETSPNFFRIVVTPPGSPRGSEESLSETSLCERLFRETPTAEFVLESGMLVSYRRRRHGFILSPPFSSYEERR